MAKAKPKVKPKPKETKETPEKKDEGITWDNIAQRLVSFCNAPTNESYRWYTVESIRDITVYKRHTSSQIAVLYKPIDKTKGHVRVSDPQFNSVAHEADKELAEWLKSNG